MLDRLKGVLSRLARFGLVIKPSKCKFGVRQAKFLGFLVNEHGVAVDPEKVTAIMDYPPPVSVGLLRRFLGMASYLRRFVKYFAQIARPLSDLLKGQTDSKRSTENDSNILYRELKAKSKR